MVPYEYHLICSFTLIISYKPVTGSSGFVSSHSITVKVISWRCYEQFLLYHHEAQGIWLFPHLVITKTDQLVQVVSAWSLILNISSSSSSCV